MHFKHPEILYTLFLLVIPIIVHLFQLRRFKKVAFTNVKFLKEVEQQTRKSSRLKKFLILLTRLFLFASLIIAFARPYTSGSNQKKPVGIYVYLDNSFSMQAKGNEGELLKRAAQDLIRQSPQLNSVTLLTNDAVYENVSGNDLKNTLLSIQYSPLKTDLQSVILRIKDLIKETNTLNNIFLISDFQKINLNKKVELDTLNTYYLAQVKPLESINISIDSAAIVNRTNESTTLNVRLQQFGEQNNEIALSLFNDGILAGKSSVIFNNDRKATLTFTLPNTPLFKGELSLEDNALPFDNKLFFTINRSKKINVTAIGTNNAFLQKIYTPDVFNFISADVKSINYNTLDKQQLIILNEPDNIPEILINPLKQFLKTGGNLVLIPGKNIDFNSYNLFLKTLNAGTITGLNSSELSVTTIHNKHPLLKGVFEKQVTNFQYPMLKSSYTATLKNASPILSFENGQSFLSGIDNSQGAFYWFSGAIDSENSNFINSPLVVPVFYNFGLFSAQTDPLYYFIGQDDPVVVESRLDQDDILTIKDQDNSYIPIQQITGDKVSISVQDYPVKDGFYDVDHNENILKTLAFNYDRQESDPDLANIEELFGKTKNVFIDDNVEKTFTTFTDTYKSKYLSIYFLLLAFLCLLAEIALLKFFKS